MAEQLVNQNIRVRASYGFFYRPALPGDDPRAIISRKKEGSSFAIDEVKFNAYSGRLIKISVSSYEYDDNNLVYYINMILSDKANDSDDYHFRLKMFDGVTAGYLDRLENVDLSRPFTLRVGKPADKKAFSWIIQNGENVPKKYTKDAPGDKPQWKKIEIDGQKPVYDKSDQRKFYDKLVDKIQKQLSAI